MCQAEGCPNPALARRPGYEYIYRPVGVVDTLGETLPIPHEYAEAAGIFRRVMRICMTCASRRLGQTK